MNMKKILLLMVIGFLITGSVKAQRSTDTIVVYYHQGRSEVDLSLKNNKTVLDNFLRRLDTVMRDSTCRLVSLRLDAYSSPEGTALANNRLAENRATRLVTYLRTHVELPETLFTVQGHGVDWEGLETFVRTEDIPYKEEVLEILQNTPEWIYDENKKVVDGRKHRLGMLRGGVPYNFLEKNVFPQLRRSCIALSYTIEQNGTSHPQQTVQDTIVVQSVTEPEQTREDSVSQSEPVLRTKEKHEFRPLIAVKTNLLYWATLMPDFKGYTFVPNLEIEWFFKECWSLSATGNYAKWGYGDDKYFGISSWSIEPRWWLKGDGSFRWFYLGAYGQIGDYDVQNNRVELDGNTGKLWGAGLSVGVAIPFSNRFGLELGIRGGYRHNKVNGYVHEASDYFREFKNTDNHWGVTGIKASLYYRLGSKK